MKDLGGEAVLVERPREGVLALWLARPAKRNALDEALVDRLECQLGGCDARAVVLGSSDDRCFSAGADLSLSAGRRARLSDRLYALYRRMLTLPCPIVAAIAGPAIGGGAQLAVASDLRVGGPSARFRFVGAGHGLAVGAWALPGLVGRGRALDLCLTMRAVEATEALRVGLLDRVEPDPRTAALDLAAELARLDVEASARVRSVARDGQALLASLDREREANRAAWTGAIDGLEWQRGA